MSRERDVFEIETLFQFFVVTPCWGPVLAIGEPFA